MHEAEHKEESERMFVSQESRTAESLLSLFLPRLSLLSVPRSVCACVCLWCVCVCVV